MTRNGHGPVIAGQKTPPGMFIQVLGMLAGKMTTADIMSVPFPQMKTDIKYVQQSSNQNHIKLSRYFAYPSFSSASAGINFRAAELMQ